MLQTNIIGLRHRNKLTQAQLAEALNITKSSLQSYETGRANPPLRILKLIIDMYKINDLYSFLYGYYETQD